MAESKIEWTRYTWNRWYGCTKVSPACDRCYAETWGRRSGLMPLWGGERRLASDVTRDAPHRWNRLAAKTGQRARVFTLSLGDFFDNKANPSWRIEAWDIIRSCPNLDWLILTKRPQNIKAMLPPDWGTEGYPHVWLGTTTENQEEAQRRLPSLLSVPAKIHWVSAEPLLTPLNLIPWFEKGLDWVVTGGETGGHERFSEPVWFADLHRQCVQAKAKFFMKQMTKKSPIPEALMIREFPA